jgi:hypothetical protein
MGAAGEIAGRINKYKTPARGLESQSIAAFNTLL